MMLKDVFAIVCAAGAGGLFLAALEDICSNGFGRGQPELLAVAVALVSAAVWLAGGVPA